MFGIKEYMWNFLMELLKFLKIEAPLIGITKLKWKYTNSFEIILLVYTSPSVKRNKRYIIYHKI